MHRHLRYIWTIFLVFRTYYLQHVITGTKFTSLFRKQSFLFYRISGFSYRQSLFNYLYKHSSLMKRCVINIPQKIIINVSVKYHFVVLLQKVSFHYANIIIKASFVHDPLIDVQSYLLNYMLYLFVCFLYYFYSK